MITFLRVFIFTSALKIVGSIESAFESQHGTNDHQLLTNEQTQLLPYSCHKYNITIHSSFNDKNHSSAPSTLHPDRLTRAKQNKSERNAFILDRLPVSGPLTSFFSQGRNAMCIPRKFSPPGYDKYRGIWIQPLAAGAVVRNESDTE